MGWLIYGYLVGGRCTSFTCWVLSTGYLRLVLLPGCPLHMDSSYMYMGKYARDLLPPDFFLQYTLKMLKAMWANEMDFAITPLRSRIKRNKGNEEKTNTNNDKNAFWTKFYQYETMITWYDYATCYIIKWLSQKIIKVFHVKCVTKYGRFSRTNKLFQLRLLSFHLLLYVCGFNSS